MKVSNYNSNEEGNEKTGLVFSTPTIDGICIAQLLNEQKETTTRKFGAVLLSLSIMCVVLLLSLNSKISSMSGNDVQMSLWYNRGGIYLTGSCSQNFGETNCGGGEFDPVKHLCYENESEGELCWYPFPCELKQEWTPYVERSFGNCGSLCSITFFDRSDYNVCATLSS